MRNRSPEEVIQLVDNYVNETAVKSGTEDLQKLMRKYLSAEAVEQQLARIAQHDKEFDENPL